MKKSSLGRRPSAVRKPSDDRRERTMIPARVREPSQDRLSTYSAQPRTPQVGPAPDSRVSRVLTLSCGSSRPSSTGGRGSKKDLRPLTEKDWQNFAVQKIQEYLRKSVEGSDILAEHRNIKNMNLPLFIKLCNFFIKKLDPNCEINRSNYINELLFLLKAFSYRGKVDKTQLQSIGTMHTWPYILGILHFLCELAGDVSVCEDLGWKLPYPEVLEVQEEEDNELNIAVIFPIVNNIFDLDEKYGPASEECRQAREALHRQVQAEFDGVVSELNSTKAEKDATDRKVTEAEEKLTQVEPKLNALLQERLEKDNEAKEMGKKNEVLRSKVSLLSKECQDLQNSISLKELGLCNKIDHRDKLVSEQGPKVDYELTKEQLNSIMNEMKYIRENITKYSDKVSDLDLQLVNLKLKIDETVRSYNNQVTEMATSSVLLRDAIIHETALEVSDEKLELCKSSLLQVKDDFKAKTEETRKSTELAEKENARLQVNIEQLEKSLESKLAEADEYTKRITQEAEGLEQNLDTLKRSFTTKTREQTGLLEEKTQLQKELAETEALITRYKEKIEDLSKKMVIHKKYLKRKLEIVKSVARRVLREVPDSIPREIQEIFKIEWPPLPAFLEPCEVPDD